MIRMSQLALLDDLNDSGGTVDGELTHTGFTHPHLQRGHPEMLHMIKRELESASYEHIAISGYTKLIHFTKCSSSMYS